MTKSALTSKMKTNYKTRLNYTIGASEETPACLTKQKYCRNVGSRECMLCFKVQGKYINFVKK